MTKVGDLGAWSPAFLCSQMRIRQRWRVTFGGRLDVDLQNPCLRKSDMRSCIVKVSALETQGDRRIMGLETSQPAYQVKVRDCLKKHGGWWCLKQPLVDTHTHTHTPSEGAGWQSPCLAGTWRSEGQTPAQGVVFPVWGNKIIHFQPKDFNCYSIIQ